MSAEPLEQIAQLVALGIPQQQIAYAVGLTQGRISQLIKDNQEVQRLIAHYCNEQTVQHVEQIATLSGIEKSLVSKVDTLAKDDSYTLMEGLRALEIVAKLKASKMGTRTEEVEPGKVSITVNSIINQKINVALASNKEIIELAGREMTTLPRGQVLELVNGRKDSDRGADQSLLPPIKEAAF